jgi:hypothetical protein
MMAGSGGWGKIIDAKSYANDAGAKLATVLNDAASFAGETIDSATIPNVAVGPHFTRESGPASRVLEATYPSAWHVGEDGKTRLGKRTSAVIDTEFTLIENDVSLGRISIVADSLVGIVPGVVVDGYEAVDVWHELDGTKLSTTIWTTGPSTTSRELIAFRRMVEALFPWLKFLGTWEYRVVTLEGNRVNLQSVRASSGMPDLRRVKIRPGVPGCYGKPSLGSMCLVTFANADRTRPVILSFDDVDSGGFASTELSIETSGSCTIEAGSTGANPWEHATSIEAVVGLIQQVLLQISIQNAGPVVGATLSPLIPTIINAAIPLAALAPVTPYSAAIVAGISAKLPDPTSQIPGICWPNVRGA